MSELATASAGSSDLYETRGPSALWPASISSPPTTASRLHDLVSYNDKHNEANGEENRDGNSDNLTLELRSRRRHG